ncbi:hypothetical protein GTP23_01915 [Pseudoduganella sp. FT93W]|uniref:Uncharacterized protein n=1 Tax=Duganella fentianensis TaxID=2692177 RepID=A0A845HS77_9BURK|nr:hypothetical protein [Duganella fentianensis]MYN43823.1 hypothetical protein [Duganella fentianensis]
MATLKNGSCGIRFFCARCTIAVLAIRCALSHNRDEFVNSVSCSRDGYAAALSKQQAAANRIHPEPERFKETQME